MWFQNERTGWGKILENKVNKYFWSNEIISVMIMIRNSKTVSTYIVVCVWLPLSFSKWISVFCKRFNTFLLQYKWNTTALGWVMLAHTGLRYKVQSVQLLRPISLKEWGQQFVCKCHGTKYKDASDLRTPVAMPLKEGLFENGKSCQ